MKKIKVSPYLIILEKNSTNKELVKVFQKEREDLEIDSEDINCYVSSIRKKSAQPEKRKKNASQDLTNDQKNLIKNHPPLPFNKTNQPPLTTLNANKSTFFPKSENKNKPVVISFNDLDDINDIDQFETVKKEKEMNKEIEKEKEKEKEKAKEKEKEKEEEETVESIMNSNSNKDKKDFYEYTEDCFILAKKVVIPSLEEIKDFKITLPFIDEMKQSKKRLAVWDLDETLIHCVQDEPSKAEIQIDVKFSKKTTKKVKISFIY